MTACVAIAGKAIMLASAMFTLSWTHSVEKTEWQEIWRLEDGRLLLEQARVKGSGAGMDPGEGALLEAGWWRWQPQLPPLEEIVLAASGATVGGWRLCDGANCRHFGEHSGDKIIIRACAAAGQ